MNKNEKYIPKITEFRQYSCTPNLLLILIPIVVEKKIYVTSIRSENNIVLSDSCE